MRQMTSIFNTRCCASMKVEALIKSPPHAPRILRAPRTRSHYHRTAAERENSNKHRIFALETHAVRTLECNIRRTCQVSFTCGASLFPLLYVSLHGPKNQKKVSHTPRSSDEKELKRREQTRARGGVKINTHLLPHPSVDDLVSTLDTPWPAFNSPIDSLGHYHFDIVLLLAL